MGEGVQVFAAAGIAPDPADGGLLLADDGAAAFVEALGKHRHPERETAPPKV
ncbi:hypothetical protein D3C72_2397280 [compost metagenome]